VGGLLVAALLIAVGNGIAKGRPSGWLMQWLRGDKAKPRGA
jgi:hypothetical protein